MGKKNFYAVKVGRCAPAIFSTWDECKSQVNGYTGAQFKGFATRQEAESFIAGTTAGPPAAGGPSAPAGPSTGTVCPPDAKRVKVAPPATGGPLPASSMWLPRPGMPASKAAHGSGVAAGEIAIFTDGACQGNRNVALQANPAGWGAVVVEGCLGAPPVGGVAVAELYGPVELNPSSSFFLGAEVGSNNTGELSAVCEALQWLISHEPSSRPAVICYDSEYAANQAQGFHRANKNIQLSQRSRQLLADARKRRTVRFLHVKGHSGHRWNDAADALANRGATGTHSAMGGDRPDPPGALPPGAPPPGASDAHTSCKRPFEHK